MDTTTSTLGDQWALALIMIVIGAWVVFKYLVPRGYKEWRNAGLVQAFIIALYAEMYGFPVTIYILTSFLHLNIPWIHFRGHLWSSLLGLGDTGAMLEMVLGLSIVLLGLTLIFRGWYLIYQARKEDKLVTSGPYRYIRHPQYTGIFLALFGQLIHWPTLPTLVLFPIIIWVYYRLARKEERDMITRFGDEYAVYKGKTPMFFPRAGQWRQMIEGEDDTTWVSPN